MSVIRSQRAHGSTSTRQERRPAGRARLTLSVSACSRSSAVGGAFTIFGATSLGSINQENPPRVSGWRAYVISAGIPACHRGRGHGEHQPVPGATMALLAHSGERTIETRSSNTRCRPTDSRVSFRSSGSHSACIHGLTGGSPSARHVELAGGALPVTHEARL